MNSPQARLKRTLSLTVAGSIVLAGIWLTFASALNRDVGWWLYVTREWLDGARLYVDLVEVNPPLMAYLNAIHLGLGGLAGIDPITSFRLFVLILVAASTCISAILISRADSNGPRIVPFVCALLFALLILPAGEFGQREHLMVLLASPYLSLVWLRLLQLKVATILAVSVGLLAGIGIALKPQFVVLGLGLEGWLLFRREVRAAWLRPETLAALGLVASYTLLVVLRYPEYIDLATRYFDAYDNFRTLPLVALLRPGYVLPVVAAAAAVWLIPQAPAGRNLARTLLVFASFALLAAILQRKGWLYHYYPSDAASVLAVGVSAIGAYSLRAATRGLRLRRVATVGLCGTALLLGLQDQLPYWRGDPMLRQKLSVANCEDTSLESVVMLSAYMGDGFPYVLYSGCEWASPFPQMWFVHAFYADAGEMGEVVRLPARERQSDLERKFVRDFSAKFSNILPDVIFVDEGPDRFLGGATFPYLAYLMQDPEFAAAMENYGRVGSCRNFGIYARDGIAEINSRACE